MATMRAVKICCLNKIILKEYLRAIECTLHLVAQNFVFIVVRAVKSVIFKL